MGYKKTWLALLVVMAMLLSLTAALGMATELGEPSYTEEWDGRGTNSVRCDLANTDDRPWDSWIHWVFSTKGESETARLTLRDGDGEILEVAEPGDPLEANAWHFYTDYYDIFDENDVRILFATIELFGGDKGPGGGLVISDYCPGEDIEGLLVVKTVDTSFEREHFWDITKKVETQKEHELEDGTPKIWLYIDGSGDERATWTVDVSYEGYEDDEHEVSGTITITNTGTLPVVITNIVDVLGVDNDGEGGTTIDLYYDQARTQPYDPNDEPELEEMGDFLTLYYCEEGYFEGFNVVTVTTARDNDYVGEAEIVWGDPTSEVNETVDIKDISDLFGEVDLGTVTAPNGDSFSYYEDFAWEDYGEDACGSYLYENTAWIVQTEQEASAELAVNVQCYVWESAWAKGDENAIEVLSFCKAGFNNWGWTNKISSGTYTWELWAGAGQCDIGKGTLVGSVEVVYDGYVTVEFNLNDSYLLGSTAVYAGKEKFPTIGGGRNRRITTAPGQYTNDGPFSGDIWVIVHANVGMPDPDFGPPSE